MYRIILLFIAIALMPARILSAQEGAIKDQLIDAKTKTPLAGANIQIMDTPFGAACDESGHFLIPQISVGAYALEFSYVGYQTTVKTDVIVRPGRITTVEMELQPTLLETETISVSAAYFAEIADQPVSTINFSGEEIRRAPGSAGDVSRIVMGLPSLAKVNDQSNSLIVRGGSPTENAFFVDNIEIPNINHFPTQGASGGPIGLLTVDLIKDIKFSTGGFNARYGDRLSSVMEISLREGNRDEFDGQADLNFAGFGTVLEGPLPGSNGSWVLSARRSYLDLLVKAVDIGSSVAPRYGDIQAKFVMDLNPNHQLIWLGVFGDDHNNPDRTVALENDMIVYGAQDIYENTTGLNWRAIWSKNFYSRSSISFTSTRFKEDFYETASTRHLLQNRSLEQALKFRTINHWQLSDSYAIEAGIEVKRIYHQVNNFFADYTDALGNEVPYFAFSGKNTATQSGIFMNLATCFADIGE